MLPLSFDWPEAPTFTKIVRNNANRDKRVVGDGPTSRDAADKENRVAAAAAAVELQRLRDCCQRAEAAAAAAEMDRKLSAEDAAAARAEAASLAQANVELRGRLAERDTEVERLKRQLASVTMELSKTSSIARYMRDALQDLTGSVRVVCRIRPSLRSDRRLALVAGSGAGGGHSESVFALRAVVDSGSKEGVVLLPPHRSARIDEGSSGGVDAASCDERAMAAGHSFSFDRVFHPASSQADVFQELEPLLKAAVAGRNVCIFAYGATGSGKTFTMDGPVAARVVDAVEVDVSGDGTEDDAHSGVDVGVVPRALRYLVQAACGSGESGGGSSGLQLSLGCFEIYNDTVRDLLDEVASRDKPVKSLRPPSSSAAATATVSSSGHAAVGSASASKPELAVAHVPVSSVDKALWLLDTARRRRAVAATRCNSHSSRSHCVVRLVLSRPGTTPGTANVVNFVDLAGSERSTLSGATSTTLTEACHVNKSLSALGAVITAIVNGSAHVPFRNCKLTRVLEPCLTGDAKTLMIVNVADTVSHHDQNLQSLRFASTVAGVVVRKVSDRDMRKTRKYLANVV